MSVMEYKVIRSSRRRTASISVDPDCSVRVMVPADLSDSKVQELVKRKSQWIKSKITQFEEIQRNSRQKEYVSGESFTYLGRNYRLKVLSGEPGEYPVKLMNGRFNVHTPPGMTEVNQGNNIREQLSRWYREHAVVRLREKSMRYARQLGVVPVSVGVKDYKSRWGSCHTDGRIYFNWRIVVAPHSIVDYVVVHELCHLVHHDHSRKFWRLLATIIPDYAERKAWLKAHGSSLVV